MSLLIGLVGRARAGKDTVAGILKETGYSSNDRHIDREWELISFAAPIKKFCEATFKFTYAQLYGEDKEKPDLRYPRADGTYLTSREAMQKVGTEVGRSCYPNIWIELGIERANEAMAKGGNAVITDVRFVNEAQSVKLAGGLVWRIFRPSADDVRTEHPSETEMNSPEMEKLIDRVICNDGTLEDLKAAVHLLYLAAS